MDLFNKILIMSFSTAEGALRYNAYKYNAQSPPFVMGGVGCSGTEKNIAECRHSTSSQTNVYYAAGVSCGNGGNNFFLNVLLIMSHLNIS